MRKHILLTGTVAMIAGAFAAPALAADPAPIVAAPVTVAAYTAAPRTWTGGYVGGNAALARGAVHDGFSCDDEGGGETFAWISTIITTLPLLGGSCEDAFGPPWVVGIGSIDNNEGFSDGDGPLAVSPLTLSGYSAGGQIGYLRQLGHGPNGFVVGGEVSANMSSIQGVLSVFPIEGDIADGIVGFYNVNAYATATLRAGFAFGRALIYAEGGLALASVTYNDSLRFNGADIAHGYVYGGGIEGRISDNVSLFFEYNRLHINHVQMVSTDLVFLTTFMDTNVDLNVFKTGFNIHFGGDN